MTVEQCGSAAPRRHTWKEGPVCRRPVCVYVHVELVLDFNAAFVGGQRVNVDRSKQAVQRRRRAGRRRTDGGTDGRQMDVNRCLMATFCLSLHFTRQRTLAGCVFDRLLPPPIRPFLILSAVSLDRPTDPPPIHLSVACKGSFTPDPARHGTALHGTVRRHA